jgi:hypothetical protein
MRIIYRAQGEVAMAIAHVFVDNSNVFGGAQRAAATLEPAAPWLAIRVYYRNLFRLVEGRHQIGLRVLAGSVPPGNDDLWDYARDQGYATDLLRRVEDDEGRLVEQAVDEMLHLKIANALLDFEPPQTIIIVSGDGRDTITNSSFPRQATRALRRGWSVEVWSWKEQCTSVYRKMIDAGNGAGRLTVRYFDHFYRSVTFVKGGTYSLAGDEVVVAPRRVEPFPATAEVA